MKEHNEEMVIGIILTLVSIFIFICVIIMIIQGEDQKRIEEQERRSIEYLTPIPIEEDIETTTATQESILSCKIIEVQELPQLFLMEEEIITNPYVDLINELTDYEKELIYKITFAEAGNQKIEGQRAVIEVILNRVLSEDFPDTVEGVLSQKNQFTTWKLRNKIRKIDQDRIIEVLDLVYEEKPILTTEYVFFATSKQTKYAEDFIQIQDHWFGVPKSK